MFSDWSDDKIDNYINQKKIYLGKQGERISHHAFYYANYYFVCQLIENNYDINFEDYNGIIPIQYFFFSQEINLDFFQKISILKQVNFLHRDNYERNCLHFLVMNIHNNQEILNNIFDFFNQKYSILFNQKDIYGKKPIDIFLTRKPERLQNLHKLINFTNNLDHLDNDNENLFQISIANNNLKYATKFMSPFSVNNIDFQGNNSFHKFCYSEFNLPLLEKTFSLIDKNIIYHHNSERNNCYEQACQYNKLQHAEYYYDKNIRSDSIIPRQLRFCNLLFSETDRFIILIDKIFMKYNYKKRNILIHIITNSNNFIIIKALNKYIASYTKNYFYLQDKKLIIEDIYYKVIINHLLKFY